MLAASCSGAAAEEVGISSQTAEGSQTPDIELYSPLHVGIPTWMAVTLEGVSRTRDYTCRKFLRCIRPAARSQVCTPYRVGAGRGVALPRVWHTTRAKQPPFAPPRPRHHAPHACAPAPAQSMAEAARGGRGMGLAC